MTYEDFIADIEAFADDESEIISQRDGQVIFPRGGREVSARYFEDESSRPMVEVDGQLFPYKKFLSTYLANLDGFAQRLFTKRTPVTAFIDGKARLESIALTATSDRAMGLIQEELESPSPFSARVVFVTADAGHGKTALLRQFQTETALKFVEGKSSFVFWHVDLQGRQLLRLSEALMGDLGDLRISGLYMPGIVRLLHHRLLVLAIDGFDELAAEQGSTDALGALAVLVQQMHNRGTIVAASRRTFFDTEDYSRRTGMLRRSVSRDCEFDQLHLLPWGSAEGDQFLSDFTLDGKRFPDPKRTYEEIVLELGDDQHPMLARPFLLAHVARGLLMYELSPSEFIRGMQDPLESVASVVKAFVDREVTHKWKAKDTGEPYLTAEQHMDLLANVAEEMWQSQVDRLDVDLIEAITATLLEEWKIEQERQRQIFEMVRMHVLLTVPTDGNARQRSFDHPEFRSYFIAMGLSTLIAQSIKTDKRDRLSYFLSIGQLPDSVARYACVVLNRDSISRNDILQLFTKALKEEWRPTFLQGNIGILVPQLLAVLEPTDPVVFDAKIPYTGLVFEGTHLRNITFEHGTFARVNFTGVSWTHVKFRECEFHEITIDEEAVYDDVSFVSCKLQGLRIRQGDGEERREYSPSKISRALKSVGIQTTDGISGQAELSFDIPPEGDRYKCARKLIRTFLNATSVSDHILSIKFKGQYLNLLQDEILPLLMEKGLIRHEDHHGGGPVQAKWRLELSVEDILAADGDPNSGIAQDFWREVASRDLSR